MKNPRQAITFLIVLLLSGAPAFTSAEEPVGLLLRKGTIAWKASLQQARNFIEEDMRPSTSGRMKVLRSDAVKDDNKFSCRQLDSPGVLRCQLACCVDLGEGDTLRFATLYFENDQFYRYDITFPLALYKQMEEATQKKYGKPTKSEENIITNLHGNQFNSIIEQWKLKNTLVVLGSRGGAGKIFLSYIHVYYIPLAQEVTKNEPKMKLPF
jgi:hypothetical protein